MGIEQNYQDTLDYIYSFVDNSLTHRADLTLKDSDLSRMQALMLSLGNPQDHYPSVHVAGSKGKGSVSAFCATVLQENGYRVGLYTSPHLRDFEERIQVNWEPISKKDLVTYVEELKPSIARIPRLNTFEIATAIAFLYFSRQKVDIAVVEVGLGGRLDATNVITPKVSAITALYLEHTKILGNTIGQIAAEKGGIIKHGVPVVISPQEDEARQVIEKIAAEREAPLIEVGVDYIFESLDTTLDSQSFKITSNEPNNFTVLEIGLLGQHQVENASTAYVALQQLRHQGFHIGEEAVIEGFLKTEWPARFEILRQNPPLIIDSAHNPDSAKKLRKTLDEFFPSRPLIIIFGVSEDKNITGMIEALISGTDLIICSQSTHPRSMDAKKLSEMVKPFGVPFMTIYDTGEALREAVELAGNDAVILVTGSIFVAATARIAWLEKLYQSKVD
jgi:dihydrofolate synthase/folylpolyglutamate synthase